MDKEKIKEIDEILKTVKRIENLLMYQQLPKIKECEHIWQEQMNSTGGGYKCEICGVYKLNNQ